MKKYKSQISLGLVCIILGLMIAFQFKTTYNSQNVLKARQFKDVAKEIDDLKKQRDDMAAKVQEYQNKVDEYEKNATNVSTTAKQMKDELDRLRFLSGLVDVHGPGVTITITPVTDLTSRQTAPLTSSDLIEIVNDLNSAGAEAISINDERYVGTTQIRDVAGTIKINDSKFDPTQRFTVKAIGAPDILNGVFKLPGSIVEELVDAGIDVKIDESQDIQILKFNKTLEYKYIKSIGR